MKTLACKDFGMKCEFIAKGDTTHEVIGKTTDHVKMEHPETWKKMKNMTPKEIEQEMLPKIKEMV